jgi:hypothetical protein
MLFRDSRTVRGTVADSPGVELFLCFLCCTVFVLADCPAQARTVRGTVAVVFQSRTELLTRSLFQFFLTCGLSVVLYSTVADCTRFAVCAVAIRFSPVRFPIRVPSFALSF